MSSYDNESVPVTEILLCAVKGFAISVIVAAVLLFGFCAIAYGTDDPDAMSAPLGYLALYLSAVCAGGASSKISGDFGVTAVLSAASAGVMLLMLIIMMSWLPVQTASSSPSPLTSVLMYAAVPAAAALAGLIFRRKRVRRTKHKRRR